MYKFFFSFIVLVSCLSLRIFSQTIDSNEVHTFDWQLSYVCDAGRNFAGGIKTGNAFMGLISAGATIHTDKLWSGGSLNFQVMNTHGHNLSENYVGDMQVISNIENGDYTFLENLFYRQDFSKISVLAGLQDLNAEFCVSEYGGGL
jgi:porin